MWQEIIIILIGLSVTIHVGRKIFLFIFHPSKTKSACSGCKGCALKQKESTTSLFNISYKNQKK